jgi:hypothetical protein
MPYLKTGVLLAWLKALILSDYYIFFMAGTQTQEETLPLMKF